MGFVDWLARTMRLSGVSEVGVNDPVLCSGETKHRLLIQAYAFELCVDFVARMVSACEIVTKIKGQKVQEKMYYRLNIEPNHNETAQVFWQKVIRKMLIDGEALVIRNESANGGPDVYLVADSYDTVKRAMIPNRYKNIVVDEYPLNRAGYKNEFSEEEVWRFRFDNEDILRYAKSLTTGLEEILDVVQKQYLKKKYTKSVIEVPGMGGMTTEAAAEKQALFDRHVRAFLQAEKDAVLPLSNSQKIGRFESVMGDGVIDDAQNIKMFTEFAVQMHAAMFNIPVQALYGETVDLTGWITSFLQNLVEGMGQELNRKSNGIKNITNKTYFQFDTTSLIPQTEIDRAKMLDYLIRAGVHTINENRFEMGLEPIDEPWADQLWMTLNYDFVGRFVEGNQGSRGDPGANLESEERGE